MPVYVGGYDPLKMIEGILNVLIARGIITREQAERIISDAKAPQRKS